MDFITSSQSYPDTLAKFRNSMKSSLAVLPRQYSSAWTKPSRNFGALPNTSLPQQGANAEVELRSARGASVSGSIRYHDGSAAIGVTIQLLRQDKESKWHTDAPGTSLGRGLGRSHINETPTVQDCVTSTQPLTIDHNSTEVVVQMQPKPPQ